MLTAIALGMLLVGCEKKDELHPEFKECIYCKEGDVKFKATICKHCGKDPDGADGAEKRAE